MTILRNLISGMKYGRWESCRIQLTMPPRSPIKVGTRHRILALSCLISRLSISPKLPTRSHALRTPKPFPHRSSHSKVAPKQSTLNCLRKRLGKADQSKAPKKNIGTNIDNSDLQREFQLSQNFPAFFTKWMEQLSLIIRSKQRPEYPIFQVKCCDLRLTFSDGSLLWRMRCYIYRARRLSHVL
jgi:hypothetical protein